MGTNTTDISTIAYADLLRDDSKAAEKRRDINLGTSTPFCDLCGRKLTGERAQAAYAYGDGRLARWTGELEDLDLSNVAEILLGNDCAAEIPAEYRVPFDIEGFRAETPKPVAAPEPVASPRIPSGLDMPTTVRMREIVEGANALAREVAEEGTLVLDATGAVLVDRENRTWLELVARPNPGDWTGGWYSHDGHVAEDAAAALRGEDAWNL